MTKKAMITVNLDVKCLRCGKKGAMQNGICMPCMTKAIKAGELNHIFRKFKPNTKGDK